MALYHTVLWLSRQKTFEHLNSEADKEDPEVVFKCFESHLLGKPSKRVMHLEFAARIEQDGKPIDEFICQSKAKAKTCQYSNDVTCDEMFTFQLVK